MLIVARFNHCLLTVAEIAQTRRHARLFSPLTVGITPFTHATYARNFSMAFAATRFIAAFTGPQALIERATRLFA